MLEERAVRGLHESLAKHIEKLPRSTPVLDLGCGSGAWLSRLTSLGFGDLTGIDLNPPPGALQANLEEPLSLGRTFGLVTSVEVIEHLGSPGRLLQTAAEHLEKDGVFLLTTPNIHSLRARLKFFLTAKLPSFDDHGDPTHVSPISIVGLERMAPRYGLALERIWTFPEIGSRVFGRPIRATASIARTLLRDPLPGDNLCVALRRHGA